MRNSILLACCAILWVPFIHAQQIWSDVDENTLPRNAERQIIPERYRTLELNTDAFLAGLREAPQESEVSPKNSTLLLDIPLPDGGFEQFRVVEYSMMEEGLASRFPEIKTYRGISIENPLRRIRFDWTHRGLRVMMIGPGGSFFIDPYAVGDRQHYISYYKSDYRGTGEPFICHTESKPAEHKINEGDERAGDCVFRSYRLAVAVTGEYSNYFDATSSADADIVLAEVVTAVNRVNEVYEVDFAIRMVLIANNDDVFYYNGNTDPFTNGNGSTMLTQNQNNMTSVIGSANYDIGHVFSTGGGGVANLQVPCNNSSKARGVTGQSNPINDPFYIDYVAHEMGHQFGANHTQYNSCNRVNATAMEPGSASTIMGYAGICSPNVQSNSDAYFHAVSVQEIKNFVSFGSGNNCDLPLTFNNDAPVLDNVPDYTIPKSTPFMLTAIATDPNNDPMSYCWEEYDNDGTQTQPPAATNTQGPMFRSLFPEESPTRYFPNLDAIVSNTTPTWEVLPSIGRAMEFRITVRDYHDVAGCTDEDNMFVTTSNGAGPFVVTSPNTNITWFEGEERTVSWNVANTNNAPVSCANVDILLSTDGGYTYPISLATSVPNDGSHNIIVPTAESEDCRVMVKGSNTVFFDISNVDFTIDRPGFTLEVDEQVLTYCSEIEDVFDVEVVPNMGFDEEVTLSLLNAPPGLLVSFSQNPVMPPATVEVTFNKIAQVPLGEYNSILNGVSATDAFNLELTIQKLEIPGTGALITPEDESTDVLTDIELSWEAEGSESSYLLELSEDPGFSTLLVDEILTTNSFSLTDELEEGTEYFWRVRPSNGCGDGNFSPTWSFTTISCVRIFATDVPIDISSGQPSSIFSEISFPHSGTILDVNILDLNGTHTWVGDLTFTLMSPAGTEVVLVDGICNNLNHFDFGFDDSSQSNPPCPPTDGLIHEPEEPLSQFNQEQALGDWQLEIRDNFNQDGGTLNGWTLEVCYSAVHCDPLVTNAGNDGPGSLREVLACAEPGDIITFDPSLQGQSINLQDPLVIAKDVTILALVAEDITISAMTATHAFEVNNGVQARMEGIGIVTGNAATGTGIRNGGMLILDDVTLYENVTAPDAEEWISNSGDLEIQGNCRLDKS